MSPGRSAQNAAPDMGVYQYAAKTVKAWPAMQYPRAHLYQTSLDQYLVRRIAPPVLSSTIWMPAQGIGVVGPIYRHFLANAGKSIVHAIDVDEWSEQDPIDVDAGNIVEVEGIQQSQCTRNAGLFACGICSDTFRRPVVTLCMHIFCDACIARNFGYSMACPMCRAPIVDPPVRDKLFEDELKEAIEMGIVNRPVVAGRRKPYTWRTSLFSV
ncbi:hypothetical protein C8F04DRAFT_1191619 [Mycena alexandri]|uniref:RING-type domain-containing protein n=1 Tax=Mycena alexandri TaxID=1745969 RepID=A0AAD6SFT9_9AGAR|nr:hypothetical protein C8F04DRAFT_1191619 [Mycena alexandri]